MYNKIFVVHIFVVVAVLCLQYFRLLLKQSQFHNKNWLIVDIQVEINEDLLKYASGSERMGREKKGSKEEKIKAK